MTLGMVNTYVLVSFGSEDELVDFKCEKCCSMLSHRDSMITSILNRRFCNT